MLGQARLVFEDDDSRVFNTNPALIVPVRTFSILALKQGFLLFCDTSLLMGHDSKTLVVASGRFEQFES